MSKEQLIHIFDDSTCLTKRQLKDYVTGVMTNEEAHAAEVHLNSCPFCNEAVEGLLEQQEGNTASVVAELNSDFLHEHFSITNPHIHLNSITASHAGEHAYVHKRKKKKVHTLWRPSSIAAAVLLFALGIWYMQALNDERVPQKGLAEAALSTASQDPNIAEQEAGRAIAENTPVTMASPKKNVEVVKDDVKVEDQDPQQASGGSSNAPQVLLYADKKEEEKTAPANEDIQQVAAADMQAATTVTESAIKAPAAIPAARNASMSNLAKDDKAETVAVKKLMKASVPVQDKMEMGDDFYKQGKYDIALAAYTQELNSTDEQRKARASLRVAECYLKLGKDSKAKEILQKLADEDGPKQREAKKILRKLE